MNMKSPPISHDEVASAKLMSNLVVGNESYHQPNSEFHEHLHLNSQKGSHIIMDHHQLSHPSLNHSSTMGQQQQSQEIARNHIIMHNNGTTTVARLNKGGSSACIDGSEMGPNDDVQMTTGDTDPINFKRRITLWNGVALIVGIIIGSGIFISPKGVYQYSGCSVGIALIVWTLCGLFSILGSLCYSELGTTITRSGGDYVYILTAFGPLAAFLRLWVAILIIRPTAQAIMALTFAQYILGAFSPGCEPPDLSVRFVAACCLCKYCYILHHFDLSSTHHWGASDCSIFKSEN